MKKPLVNFLSYVALVTTIASFSAAASDDEPYTFVGFGLSQYNDLDNLDLSKVDIDLVPEIFVGFGKQYQLNEDWLLATEVSLHYAKTHFSGYVESTAEHDSFQGQEAFSATYASGNYEALGLWATSRFNYLGLSERVSPFIELAVGMVETNHGTLLGEEKNHGIGYKAVTGLEFEAANNMTISLGYGISNNDSKF
ncbi:outer membrane beta-barrel protein [Shewanella sp.]|uniref:outer membrane beta-barrel protein n=1 Tax=Shewanella sp. TaxID=50422 RepID=UPI0025DCEA72|nr:outer membrane beta-barrel protein [Shewanella sp.]